MRNFLAASLLLTFLSPLSAGTRLEWSFTPGDTFRLERIYKQSQEIEVKDRSYKQEITSTWLTRIDVKEKKRDSHVLQITLEEVDYKASGVGGAPAVDDKLVRKLKGMTLTLTVNSPGQIKKLQGYDEFIKRVAEGETETEKVLRSLFSEEGLRESYEEVLAFLPRKTVEKGARWKRTAIDPLPPFGSFQSKYEYTYGGMEEGMHVIPFTISTTYRKPVKQPDLFRIVKGSLTGEEGRGRFFFDASAGRLVRGGKSMVVRGELTIETGGVETVMRFVSRNRLNVRMLPADR